jgi:SAM-dependent methyltransferase
MSDSEKFKPIEICACCGADTFVTHPVLWKGLIDEWGLSPIEINYINRQQGVTCKKCGNNLRSIALAKAILSAWKSKGNFKSFVRSPRTWLLQILEINPAGSLTEYFSKMPRRTLAVYPEVDMQRMPYASDRFDLVVHSDTLEHVPNPVLALSECQRVLKPGGFCCFTIPIILGRLTRTRSGLPPSYHGEQSNSNSDFLVQTEYGSDFWTQLFEAGFAECRIVSAEFPSAQAIVAQKPC